MKERNLEREVLWKSDIDLNLPKKMSELRSEGWEGRMQCSR